MQKTDKLTSEGSFGSRWQTGGEVARSNASVSNPEKASGTLRGTMMDVGEGKAMAE